MARIPDTDLQRLKEEISVQRLEAFVSFHKGLRYTPPLDWMHGGNPYDMVIGPLYRRGGIDAKNPPIPWPGVSPQTSIHTPSAAQLFNSYMVRTP
jgi:hypothetical protein